MDDALGTVKVRGKKEENCYLNTIPSMYVSLYFLLSIYGHSLFMDRLASCDNRLRIRSNS